MAYNPGVAGGQLQASGPIPAPVSSSFCVPYVAQFVIEQKVFTISSGKFIINDAQGKLLFQVGGKISPVHTKRIVKDSAGTPLVLLKAKAMTMHDRWEAYRGESSDDLLFVMKKSAIFQMKPKFEIFLASNKQMEKPDFTLKGDFFAHSYSVFHNEIAVAEVSKKLNASSFLLGKDQYGVTVYPGVDHAFIASVIVIMDQVKQQDASGSGSGGGFDISAGLSF